MGERVPRGGYSGQQEELGLHRGCWKKPFNGDMAMKWIFISTPSGGPVLVDHFLHYISKFCREIIGFRRRLQAPPPPLLLLS